MNILKMLGVNEKDMDSIVKGVQKYAMEIDYLYKWSKEVDKTFKQIEKRMIDLENRLSEIEQSISILEDNADLVFDEAIPEFKSMLEAKENQGDDNNV